MYKISIKDSGSSDFTPFLDDVTLFIEQQISTNKTVLVHCKGGINRSPVVVVAYLSRYVMPFEAALELVKAKRNSVRFQDHYIMQIQRWLQVREGGSLKAEA